MLLVKNILALRQLQPENILTLCEPLIDSDSAFPPWVGPDQRFSTRLRRPAGSLWEDGKQDAVQGTTGCWCSLGSLLACLLLDTRIHGLIGPKNRTVAEWASPEQGASSATAPLSRETQTTGPLQSAGSQSPLVQPLLSWRISVSWVPSHAKPRTQL